MAQKETGKIVTEYLEKYPSMPTRTLASKIYKERGEVFNNYEHVRTLIKMYRGKLGKNALLRLKDKRFIKENSIEKLTLPEEAPKEDYSPYIIPQIYKKCLIIADLHIPDHCNIAIQAALDYGKQNNIDSILILGDLIDGYSISNFSKDPSKYNLKDEIIACKQFLDYLKQEFPNAKIFFKAGNHCSSRLNRYLMDKAPALFGLEECRIEVLLGLFERGIEFINDRRLIKWNNLLLLHGHELGLNSCQVNPARSLYLKSKVSAFCAHLHRTSEHLEKNLNGIISGCWSVACLQNLQPDYRPHNMWNHGCAIISRNGDGEGFTVDNRIIIDGKVV